MLNYGYRSTARHLRAHFDTYRQAFAAYGIDVSLEGLQEDNPWEQPASLAEPPSAPPAETAAAVPLDAAIGQKESAA